MSARFKINSEILYSKVDQEVVLMSVEEDSYFGLDPVGSRIWELISQQNINIDDLVSHLLKEYEIDKTTCKEHVQHFINELLENNLIKILH